MAHIGFKEAVKAAKDDFDLYIAAVSSGGDATAMLTAG